MRWKMIQKYDFDIEHVAGEQNVIADTFSRLVKAKDLHKETIAQLIGAKVQNESKQERGFRLSTEQYQLTNKEELS